jgi:GGDEF domain-containing protein
MTGVPNRRVLRGVLDGLDETSGPVALLLLDINNFKEINDGLGHDVGDRVLGEVATRLGGDEFAAVVPAPRARCCGSRTSPIIALSERASARRGTGLKTIRIPSGGSCSCRGSRMRLGPGTFGHGFSRRSTL